MENLPQIVKQLPGVWLKILDIAQKQKPLVFK
jgi:hypothetical protein